MLKYIFFRILAIIPILLGISFIIFALFWLIPGDVVDIMIGDQLFGNPEIRDRLISSMGLDQPFYIQYGRWILNAMRGDLGISYISGHSVASLIRRRVNVNIEMMAMAMLYIIIIGIPAGIIAAYKQFSIFDNLIRIIATLGYSIPNFWLATLVVLVSSLYFRWIPVLEYVPFRENPLKNMYLMLIPGFVLSMATLSYIMRMTRSSALEVLRQDYVRTARAKGASEKVVLFIHVLKNSLIPVVTVLGFRIGSMFGAFVLTEHVFMLRGTGSLLLGAINQRDLTLAAGVILLIATTYAVLNLIVDILYVFLDPRIKYT